MTSGTAARETPVHDGRHNVEVEEITTVADGIVAVTFRTTGGELPEWSPGAHVELELSNGTVRQYSLCGPVDDRQRMRITVLRELASRGGSRAIHELTTGDRLRIRAVRNLFPMDVSPGYVFVAGGIGISPLLPMIEAAESRNAQWELHYTGRELASMAYATLLRDRYGDRVTLYPRVDNARLDVTDIVSAAPPGASLYCCGPERLMDHFERACDVAGCEGRMERFGAAADKDADITADAPFDVHFARSGITITVDADHTILQVAEAAGADVFASCEEGICGTCETRVLEGDVDHRDSVLCGGDTGTMMICVSRARGERLVLDA